jgi:hypothetical protein
MTTVEYISSVAFSKASSNGNSDRAKTVVPKCRYLEITDLSIK